MSGKVTAGARLTKLGRYEVLNELGKGAMGVVYLAKDPVIGRLVAVKTIRASQNDEDDSESREFRERFVREAQTAGILSHPNIVTIHDIGEDTESRTSFIAMEYIEGRNLKSLLQDKNKFTWDEIADLIAQIGEALDYAHRKGIIHRDIKPANIIMTTDGKIKITDFGIAKVASSNLTTTGQFLGTPNYMSPEQVSGAPVDGRSDIFSLGVVLYELLTNRKPFQGDNLTAISYKIVHEDFTPPGDLSADVPHEFNPIVARAMAKDPWNRYQRGKDMALALYQLKAHLEEEKALQDLGTMVSAAESLPTMKLGNLMELAAQAAPRDASMPPPSVPAPPAPPPPAASVAPPVPSTITEVTPDHPGDSSGEHEATTASPVLATEMMILPPLPERLPPAAPAPPTREVAPTLPPPVTPRPSIAPPAAPDDRKKAAGVDVRKLAKAEVNPQWFWMVTAVAAGALVLLVAFFTLRARAVSTPIAQPDPVREQAIKERHQALEDTKRLVAAGKYEEALVKARQVLNVSPNNEEARKYAQMAESGIQSRQAENDRHQQAAASLAAAKVALADGKNEDAKRKAEEALSLDASNTEAASVRDEAEGKIVAARAAEEANRKKDARAKEVQAAKKKESAPAPSPATKPTAAVAQGPSPAPAAVPGTATLRLVVDVPAGADGANVESIMVVLNNSQRLPTDPLPFKKNDTRTTTLNFTVPAGPTSVKVWLSGVKMSTAIGEANLQLPGGETRSVKVEYTGGKTLALRPQ